MSSENKISLPTIVDDRGSLVSLEVPENIPFNVKRVYYLFGLKSEEPRGFHAHKALKQMLVCVSGSCRLILDDGLTRESITLDSPKHGVFIDSYKWREMHDFTEDCVLLVLASDVYKESDYIRDYDTFKMELKNGQ